MNADLYLQRIGIGEKPPATAAGLALLQRQHLLHVPFENLDIRNRVPIPFHPAAFYEKIVVRGRGGYCYECNGLFHRLLTILGFRSRMISCRIVRGGHASPPFDHMALIVTINGEEWLTDVGFGDFSLQPLLLREEGVQDDGHEQYAIRPFGELEGEYYLSACKWHAGMSQFLPKYIFTSEGHSLADFREMHHYQQTSPDSHFTKNTICSKATRDGRLSLINNRLIETVGQVRKERHILTEKGRRLVLERCFGISNGVKGPDWPAAPEKSGKLLPADSGS